MNGIQSLQNCWNTSIVIDTFRRTLGVRILLPQNKPIIVTPFLSIFVQIQILEPSFWVIGIIKQWLLLLYGF
ncbi:hypothetical protein ACKI16_48050, partial [Streptomyces scabiei]|uniref:hypothetical protein n=1 Tax=Streptomyces scabiei TaxID=1930 RepID=UPI0038F6B9D1